MAKTFTINGKIYTDLGEKFDEGTFGQIFLVKDDTDKKYILKKAKPQEKLEYTIKNFETTEKEFDILKKIEECPHIIKAEAFLREDNDVFILLEYGKGGDLLDFINNHLYTEISLQTFESYTMQLLEAVNCFHSLNIFNLDIKPENIIFKDADHKNLAFIDFGLAEIKKKDEKCSNPGTDGYHIPQERMRPYDCAKADIYSLGVVINYLYNITFFPDKSIKSGYEKVIKKMMNAFVGSRFANVIEIIDEILKIYENMPLFLYYIKKDTKEEDLKGYFSKIIENDVGALSQLKDLVKTNDSILLKSNDGFVILRKNENANLDKFSDRILEKNVRKILELQFKSTKSLKNKKKSKSKTKKSKTTKSKTKKSLKKKSKTPKSKSK